LMKPMISASENLLFLAIPCLRIATRNPRTNFRGAGQVNPPYFGPTRIADPPCFLDLQRIRLRQLGT
jgi:hypothetical protein